MLIHCSVAMTTSGNRAALPLAAARTHRGRNGSDRRWIRAERRRRVRRVSSVDTLADGATRPTISSRRRRVPASSPSTRCRSAAADAAARDRDPNSGSARTRDRSYHRFKAPSTVGARGPCPHTALCLDIRFARLPCRSPQLSRKRIADVHASFFRDRSCRDQHRVPIIAPLDEGRRCDCGRGTTPTGECMTSRAPKICRNSSPMRTVTRPKCSALCI